MNIEIANLSDTFFNEAGTIANFVRLCHEDKIPYKISKLAGDASVRNYYRISNENNKSVVVMELNLAKRGSEEGLTFNKNRDEMKEYSFINVHRFLKSIEIPVPEIYLYDEKRGILFLEDLGDELFQYHIRNRSDSFVLQLYKCAIEILCDMQSRAEKNKLSYCYAFNRAFDFALFDWEFNHFIEYGLRQAKEYDKSERTDINSEDITMLREKFNNISRTLDSENKIFNHRDYHSRNILVKNNKLFLIDFQDAILAPKYYDLASLLRDAYVTLSEGMIDELFYYYLDNSEITKRGCDSKRERYIFDLVSIQRNMKAIGRFYFIDKVKKNPKFLQYIPNTFNYALANFNKYDDLKIISDTLLKYMETNKR